MCVIAVAGFGNFNTFYGTDRTASILSSIEKCQVLKFGIDSPKEFVSSASVGQYTCSMLCQNLKALLIGCVLVFCSKNIRLQRETSLTRSVCDVIFSLNRLYKIGIEESAIQEPVS